MIIHHGYVPCEPNNSCDNSDGHPANDTFKCDCAAHLQQDYSQYQEEKSEKVGTIDGQQFIFDTLRMDWESVPIGCRIAPGSLRT